MITTALLALALAPQDCGSAWHRRFEAHGTVQVIQGPLPFPLQGAATGDPVVYRLEFTDDPSCTTAAGLPGPPAQLDCTRVFWNGSTFGPLGSALICPWGETLVGTDVTAVDVDFSLGGSAFFALRLRDPNVTVGVGSNRPPLLPGYPIDIAAVSDPAFTATMEIADSTGVVRGVVDLTLLTFEDPAVPLGTTHCLSTINFNGTVGVTGAFGSAYVADDDLTLTAEDVTRNAFGFFICSRAPGNVPHAGGSSGVLCLGAPVGRFLGPGQILHSGSNTRVSITPSLTAFPQPTSFVAVQPGETWYFQYWFREPGVGGAPASNFASGCQVTLL